VRYRDAERRTLQPHYEKIEGSWEPTVEGFRQAVALFRKAGVPSGDWLPYRYLLFAPAMAAASGVTLDEKWIGWAIVASLWRHYAGEVDTKLQRDAQLAHAGDVDGLIDHVKVRAKRTESAIPDEEDVLRNIVSEGGAALAMLVYLCRVGARSFPGGKLVAGAHEPLEVRPIFPRSVLDRFPERDNEYVPDRLGNLTVLTRSDHEELGELAPAQYLHDLDPRDRFAHLLPEDSSVWWVESYKTFCEQRERSIAAMIRDLLVTLGVS
jgi:hypothetical protein